LFRALLIGHRNPLGSRHPEPATERTAGHGTTPVRPSRPTSLSTSAVAATPSGLTRTSGNVRHANRSFVDVRPPFAAGRIALSPKRGLFPLWSHRGGHPRAPPHRGPGNGGTVERGEAATRRQPTRQLARPADHPQPTTRPGDGRFAPAAPVDRARPAAPAPGAGPDLRLPDPAGGRRRLPAPARSDRYRRPAPAGRGGAPVRGAEPRTTTAEPRPRTRARSGRGARPGCHTDSRTDRRTRPRSGTRSGTRAHPRARRRTRAHPRARP
jgi:hypothetical protein